MRTILALAIALSFSGPALAQERQAWTEKWIVSHGDTFPEKWGHIPMNEAGMDSTPHYAPLPPVRPANIDKGKKP